MRTNLKVPFAEKEEAKKLGAKWDAARKIWFVQGRTDLAPFARWSPVPHDSLGGNIEPAPESPARQQVTGKVIVGSAYSTQPRVCACLPWEVCDQCRTMALAGW